MTYFSAVEAAGTHLGVSIYIAFSGIEIGVVTVMLMLKRREMGDAFGHYVALFGKGMVMVLVIQSLPLLLSQGAKYACYAAAGMTTVVPIPTPGPQPDDDSNTFLCQNGIQPVAVMGVGITLWSRMMAIRIGAQGRPWWDLVGNAATLAVFQFFIFGMGLGVILCCGLMAIELFGILVELLVVSALGPALMGLGAWRELSGYAKGVANYGAEVVIRLFFFYVFLGLGIGMLSGIESKLVQGASLIKLFTFCLIPLIWLYLILRMNGYVASIVRGSSNANMIENVTGMFRQAISAQQAARAQHTASVGSASESAGDELGNSLIKALQVAGLSVVTGGAGAAAGATSAATASRAAASTSTILRQSIVVSGQAKSKAENSGSADAPPKSGSAFLSSGPADRRSE